LLKKIFNLLLVKSLRWFSQSWVRIIRIRIQWTTEGFSESLVQFLKGGRKKVRNWWCANASTSSKYRRARSNYPVKSLL